MSRIKPFHSLGALLMVLCLGLASVPALAQSQASSGQITGAVVDNQGAIVANASVKAVNTQTGLERTVTSGEDGIYTIILLPPGIYRVTATAQGFSAITVDNVEVTVGRTIDVKITLGVSGVQEVVNVTAGSIQVQTTRSEADAVVNQRAIENRRTGRPSQAACLLPVAAIRRSRRIDLENMVERAEEIGNGHRTGFHLGTLSVGLADDLAALDAAAGQRHVEGARVVVPAGTRVDLRRAPEFAHPDDQRVVQSPAVPQIGDQGAEAGIDGVA